jgi:hypothetical protein
VGAGAEGRGVTSGEITGALLMLAGLALAAVGALIWLGTGPGLIIIGVLVLASGVSLIE